jgi:hypothetical protein
LDRVDKEHIDEVKDLIEEVYGENNVAQWKKYVQYYSAHDAKEQFNADTVITLSLPKKKDGYYIRPYPYCSVLILKKAGRGCLPMFCFYDEVGKKNLEKYMSDMKGTFRYGDEPPLIDKLVRTRDIVTIRSLPRQKKQDPIR